MKQEQTYRIIGVAPLIVHNGRLANPFDSYAKQMKKISSKRNKTDADLEELAKIEWYGGLYTKNGFPCIPGECVEAMFIKAAKKRKLGEAAKAGFRCEEDFLLEYDGPQSVDALWECEEFRFFKQVKLNGRSKVMRMRPIFHDWATTIRVIFNDELLDPAQVTECLTIGGDIIGLGDWIPRFGRYRIA